MPSDLWLVESWHKDTWAVAYSSDDRGKAEHQYNLCRNMFPDGVYRLILLVKRSDDPARR